MSKRLLLSMICTAALLGCGGGGGDREPQQGALTIYTPDQTTSNVTVTVYGSGFVPTGSKCTYVDPRPWGPYPYCDCEVGSGAHLTWANEASATSGEGNMSLQSSMAGSNCGQPSLLWIASVPLESGTNVITITLSDANTVGTGTLTVTRN